MKPGHTYRHPGLLDLDMHVLRVPYRGPEYLKLKVAWVKRRTGEVLATMPERLMRRDLHKWTLVNGQEDKKS
jgi:hypothetical protein